MSQRQSKEALLKSYNTRLKDDVKSMLENFEGNLKKIEVMLNKQILKLFYRNNKTNKR